jgi:hypothetical protein
MSRIFHALGRISAALLAIAGLAACGQSTHDSGPVVAEVGHTQTITRSTLSHWMSTIVGGDYYEHIGVKAPDGLVSDPPNYPACISAIERIGPAKTTSQPTSSSRQELEGKCRLLYQLIKQQALTFLLSQLWSEDEDAEHGIRITNTEVKRAFERYRTTQFPTQAALTTYLANHHWSLSDELDLIRRDLLETRIEEFVARRLGKAHATPEAVERATIAQYERSVKVYTPRTHCRTGYLASDCSDYKAPAREETAPAPLLEQIVASR